MWDAVEILGGFIEIMPVSLSVVMMMRFWMSGVTVLMDVLVVLHAFKFEFSCD